MLYLSQLLGAPVEDLQGERIGKLSDVLVPAAQVGQPGPVYPSALLIEGAEDQSWRVPPDAVEWHENTLQLRLPLEDIPAQPPAAQEVSLAQEVLDKQVIDIERKKAVRVNDVCFGDNWVIGH
jgi:magnesium transporter